MPHNNTHFLKLAASILLLLLSGILSSVLYFYYWTSGGAWLPGLLYTSATVLLFLLAKKSFSIKNLLIYYALMILTYLAIWLLTWLSSFGGFLFGILTAGIGALITFILTNKFITPIRYSKAAVFATGSAAFVATDLLYAIFNQSFGAVPVEYFFSVPALPEMLFLEVFIFWQSFVGTKLFLTLKKNRQENTPAN